MKENKLKYIGAEFDEHRSFWNKQIKDKDDFFLFENKSDGPTFFEQTFPLETEVTQLLRKSTGENDVAKLVLLLSSVVSVISSYDYSTQSQFQILTPALLQKENSKSTIPLFLECDKSNSIKTLIKQIQSIVVRSFKYQKYPVDSIMEDLRVSKMNQLGVCLDSIGTFAEDKTPSLIISLKDDDSISELTISSNLGLSELFISNLGKKIINFLGQLKESDVLIRESVALLDSEKQIYSNLNDTIVDWSENTIVDLLEIATKANLNKKAIVFKDVEIGYKELGQLTNGIANRLQSEYQMGKGKNIAILLEKSDIYIQYLIGILKSGATYIPIDVEYPEERINQILEITSPSLVITSLDFLSVIDKEYDFLYTDVEDVEAVENFVSEIEPNDIAYNIFTSGSAGTPKGVVVRHGAISNTLNWAKSYYELSNQDNGLLLPSLAFDSSIQVLFATLISGGTLVIPEDKLKLNVNYLKSLLQKHQVNNMFIVPSLYKVLLSEIQDELQQFKFVTLAGEKVTDDILEVHKSKLPELVIYNEYGPTESSVTTSNKKIDLFNINNSIGTPIANTAVHIRNEIGQCMPIGALGEICIEGKGLANGYLADKEKTKNKFVQFENTTQFEKRYYRTGDLGKVNYNNEIEIKGRTDEQVKIRGYRVELGEIENTINKFPKIDFSIVKLADYKGGEKLIAYLVALDNEDISKELDTYLKEIIPSYMVPQYYVLLEEVPLTHNGKINKNKLPLPNQSIKKEIGNLVPPNTLLEKQLIKIWKEVLKQEEICAELDFFNQGGDSIKILVIISEIQKVLSVDISVEDFYDHPSIKQLANFIEKNKSKLEAQSIEKSEIKRALEKQVSSQDNNGLLIDEALVEDTFPLSSIQKGMVYSSLLDSSSEQYHDQILFETKLELFNEKAFGRAVDLMVQKHPILRTVYNVLEEKQSVLKPFHFKVGFDYSELSPTDLMKHVNLFLQSERKIPFKFDKPLWRINVFSGKENTVIVALQVHHSIIDGWSDASFVRELAELYFLCDKDENTTITSLKSSYKDYVLDEIMNKDKNDLKVFWENELAQFEKQILFDEERTLDEFVYELSSEQLEKLNNFCSFHKITTKHLSLAAFVLTINQIQYSNKSCFGIVTNNRPALPDGDKILGCFLNTPPFIVDVDLNTSILSFIEKIKKKEIDLKKYGVVTLPDIIEQTSINTSIINPLFDIIFNFIDFHVYQNMEVQKSKGTDVSFAKVGGFGLNNYPFNFTVDVTGNLYKIGLQLDKKLLSKKLADYIGNLYVNLLTGIIENPKNILRDLPYLDKAEKQKIHTFGSNNSVEYNETSLISIFESIADKYSDNAALKGTKNSYTYKELNRIVNEFAYYLSEQHNVSSGNGVGIYLQRGEWGIISILAILKLNAYYIPVDIQNPDKRIEQIYEDSKWKVCINQNVVEEFNKLRKNNNSGAKLWDATNRSSLNDLIYKMYTSGTTGKPKGISITNANALNTLLSLKDLYKIKADENIILASSLAFDASVEQIFLAFINGARLVILDEKSIRNPEDIMDIIELEKITHLHTVPSLLKQIFRPSYTNLKRVIAGGEECPKQLAEKWSSQYEFYNEYGLTESSITTIVHKYKSGDQRKKVPIGKPLSNFSINVLGENDKVLPVGVVGEICMSGIGVSQDVFSEKNPSIYHTRDWGRWLDNGDLEWLGRKDSQLKIRGYRIEPEEIKSVLCQHPDIVDAEVILKQETLKGYIVTENEIELESILSFLKTRLPSYMTPSTLVIVDHIPKRISGKVDSATLINMSSSLLMTNRDKLLPNNPVEVKLLNCWSEITGIPKDSISTTDNFFDFGGNSLTALKFISRLNKENNFTFQINDFYLYPTIQSLSISKELKGKKSPVHHFQKNKIETKQNMFVIPGIFGQPTIFQPLVKSIQDKVNAFGFSIPGLMPREIYVESFDDLLSIYKQHILNIHTNRSDGFTLVAYSFGCLFAFELTRVLQEEYPFINLVLIDENLEKFEFDNKELTDDESTKEIIKNLNSVYGIDIELGQGMEYLENYLKMSKQYKMSGKIRANVIVFESMDEGLKRNTTGLSNWIDGEFEHFYIEGNHFEMLERKQIEIITTTLKNKLFLEEVNRK